MIFPWKPPCIMDFPHDFPQLGPLSNPFPWLLDTSNSALLEDRFCGRWRLQPFSSDGHPVFARYDCSEKGALGRRWETAKDQINSWAGTSKSGDKSQILGGIKNSKTGAGRFLAGFWCEQSSYVGCFLQGVDSSSCTTALLRSSLALQKAVR